MGWFQNLRITRKLVVVFGGMLALVLLLGGVSLRGVGSLGAAADEFSDNWMPSVTAARNIQVALLSQRTSVYQTIAYGDDENIKIFSGSYSKYSSSVVRAIDEYKKLVLSDDERRVYERLVATYAEYSRMTGEIINHALKHEDEQARKKALAARDVAHSLVEAIDQLVAINQKGADGAQQHIDQVHDEARIFISVLVVVVFVLAIASGLALGNGIGKPVVAMTGAMRRLAEGDMTVDIPARGRGDEVGAMADAVEVFKENAIKADRMAAGQEAARVEKEHRNALVAGLIKDFDDKVSEVLGVVGESCTEMTATAQTLSASSEEMTRQASTVAAATEQVSANVQTVASAAEELSASIVEIGRQVTTSSEIARTASVDAEHANGIVQKLAEVSGRISEVVNLITSIASQTNLLALNATIEAARAGEAGKGFAVVAGEVKNLAAQTAKATEDISAQIAEVQSSTHDVVEAIGGVVQRIGELSSISATIAAAVEQQSAAAGEIARNIAEAHAGASEVSNNISGVTEAASENNQSARMVLGAASELEHQASELAKSVDVFLVGVRNASDESGMAAIEGGIADHIAFAEKVMSVLAGHGKVYASELTTHETCRLGKWYRSVTDERIRTKPAFSTLLELHRQVHAEGKKVLELWEAGDQAAARQMAEKMNASVKKVIESLHRLKKEVTGDASAMGRA